MITSIAEVIDSKDDFILVRCQPKSGCGNCPSKSQCSIGTVNNALPNKNYTIKVPTDKKISIGSMVEIGMSEALLLKSAMLLYLLPLSFALITALISQLFVSNEIFIIAAALFAGVVGFVFASQKAKKFENRKCDMPRLLGVISSPVEN